MTNENTVKEMGKLYSLRALSFTRLRRLFYLVTPNETSFEKLESVPDYVSEATPWFIMLIFLEILYSLYKKKNLYRINDAVTSLNSGILQQTIRVLFCSFEFSISCWIYENYGLHFLHWNSIWTWIIAFLAVDFTYYWFHRGAHEINFFWSFHQMHHSSEDYNLSTALRKSMFQPYIAMLYNLPESFILPPSVHMVHLGLNKISQFWVHTQLINTLGPLEYILVTPSHHRVHHGRNRYCIDKNYSGILIIWDRIFGTFQSERPDEPIVYGLVHNVNTFDALYCQFHHCKHIFFEKIPSMKSFKDKLKAMFYGPGWFPGTPRMGNLNDIPKIENPAQKYDPHSSIWILIYCLLQLNMINFIFMTFANQRESTTFLNALVYSLLLIYSAECVGSFFDNKFYAPHFEIIRCTFVYYWFFERIWPPKTFFDIYANVFFNVSTAIWTIKIFLLKLKNRT